VNVAINEALQARIKEVERLEDEIRRLVDVNETTRKLVDEQHLKLMALENQVTSAEGRLYDFKKAVTAVIRELAKE